LARRMKRDYNYLGCLQRVLAFMDKGRALDSLETSSKTSELLSFDSLAVAHRRRILAKLTVCSIFTVASLGVMQWLLSHNYFMQAQVTAMVLCAAGVLVIVFGYAYRAWCRCYLRARDYVTSHGLIALQENTGLYQAVCGPRVLW